MTPPTHPLQEGSFDPLALLRRSRGDNDLRDIKLRLLWLRQREPAARIRTKLVSLDERAVVMSARITLADGGSGAAHAASATGDTPIEEAIAETELRALGRALDILGYIVTDTAAVDSEPESPPEAEPSATSSPDPTRQQPPGHVQAIRALRERGQQPQGPPAPDAEASDRIDMAPTPIEPTPSRSPQRGPSPVHRANAPNESVPVDLSERRRPAAPQEPPPTVADDDEEPELEDISWTAFWKWTRREYQIGSRGQVEELLGQPVDRKTPGELRQLLITHFEANPQGNS